MSLLASQSSARAVYDSENARWLTYAELSREAAPWTEALHSTSKPLIFCFARNDVASLAIYLAALDGAGAIALLPDSLPEEFQTRLITAYQPEFVFASKRAIDYASAGYEGDKRGLWRRSAPVDAPPLHADLAVLLSTSGSTGSPKFVRLSHGNIRSNAVSIAEALRIAPPGRAIASLPMHYSYGLSVVDSYLVSGAAIVLTDEGLMSPAFWNLVRETECDSFAGVPYSYQVLDRLRLDNLNVPSIKTLTQAGGKLQPQLITKFHETITRRGGQFFTMYGQTEATARIAVLTPEALPEKLGSVGKPVPGGSITIEAGEIVYSGPNVMLGYAETRADLARGDVQQGRLRTADLGHLDKDGCLYITGRIKREAKIFGLRVNLDELETMVRAHGPAAAVLGGSDRLCIYCEFDEQLFAGCREELATKLKINNRAFEFRRIERIPTTSAGKIDYPALESRP